MDPVITLPAAKLALKTVLKIAIPSFVAGVGATLLSQKLWSMGKAKAESVSGQPPFRATGS